MLFMEIIGVFNKKRAADHKLGRRLQILVGKLKCILLLWKQYAVNDVDYAIARQQIGQYDIRP